MRPWWLLGPMLGAVACLDLEENTSNETKLDDGGKGGNVGIDGGGFGGNIQPDAAGATGGMAAGGGAGGSAGGGAVGGGGAGGTGAGGGGTGGTVSAGALGDACVDNSSCQPGLFCLQPNTYGGTSASKVCTKSCCKTDDCSGAASADNFVCFPTIHGAGMCFLFSSVGLSGIGSVTAGGNCGADTDCRSGLCGGGICLDHCCSSASCPASASSCILQPIPKLGRSAFVCGKSAGGGYQSTCTTHADCASQYCSVASPNEQCTMPCCRKADCGSWVCAYTNYNGEHTTRSCVQLAVGSSPSGSSCVSHNECASGLCVEHPGGRVCSEPCCEDANCGPGYRCLPGAPGQDNGTFCLPA